MNKITTTLLLLFSILFALPTTGQNPTKQLDRKMMRQLKKEFLYQMKHYGPHKNPFDEQMNEFDFMFTSPIELWQWQGDTTDLYVNYLECKDTTLYQYAKKEVYKAYEKKTLFDLERMIAYFRVDTINGDTIVCFHAHENSTDNLFTTMKWEMEAGGMKGLWKVGFWTVVVYGNVADRFFNIIENVPMKSPLPPHSSVVRYKKDLILLRQFNCEHKIYETGRLNRCHKDEFIKGRRNMTRIHDDQNFLDYIRKVHK